MHLRSRHPFAPDAWAQCNWRAKVGQYHAMTRALLSDLGPTFPPHDENGVRQRSLDHLNLAAKHQFAHQRVACRTDHQQAIEGNFVEVFSNRHISGQLQTSATTCVQEKAICAAKGRIRPEILVESWALHVGTSFAIFIT